MFWVSGAISSVVSRTHDAAQARHRGKALENRLLLYTGGGTPADAKSRLPTDAVGGRELPGLWRDLNGTARAQFFNVDLRQSAAHAHNTRTKYMSARRRGGVSVFRRQTACVPSLIVVFPHRTYSVGCTPPPTPPLYLCPLYSAESCLWADFPSAGTWQEASSTPKDQAISIRSVAGKHPTTVHRSTANRTFLRYHRLPKASDHQLQKYATELFTSLSRSA